MNKEEQKNYEESFSKVGEPILLSECPKIQMDLKALMEYAQNQNKRVQDLSEEEKKRFIR